MIVTRVAGAPVVTPKPIVTPEPSQAHQVALDRPT